MGSSDKEKIRLSQLGVDELLDIVNDPDTDPELRERARRFLYRQMDMEQYK